MNSNKEELTEKHSFIKESIFLMKVYVLTVKRFFQNIITPVKRFNVSENLIDKSVVSFSESDLWNPFDNEKNWILTAGKIQNLRIASKYINGIEINANEVFSFWKHIGNPNFGKGYVVGREVREGCIVPTIAGGLCQLSNALYDAALKANFDIIERHQHTKIVKGSLAEQNRDATVKWNYVDLRFKSTFDFRIEVELTTNKFIVAFKSIQKNTQTQNNTFTHHTSDKLNDCYSCGNLSCFKHPNKLEKKQKTAKTTFILDEKWAEFDEYIQTISNKEAVLILPFKQNKILKTNRYNWTIKTGQTIKRTTKTSVYRALKLRSISKTQNNVFESILALDKKIANEAAKLIPIESTHLVIAQNLLPFLLENGALGGRTYDVLMTRLPVEILQQRLDTAFDNHPNSPTLNDFRASKTLIRLENSALTKARKIITPHSDITNIFHHKAIKLTWKKPNKTVQKLGQKILFPASLIGRKGGYEIKKLAKDLELKLVVIGNKLEHKDFLNNFAIEKFNGNFSEIGLVVYPAYIEHQPRLVLNAISKGIPVITTTACGLNPSENVTIIKTGNYDQLKTAVLAQLSINNEQKTSIYTAYNS